MFTAVNRGGALTLAGDKGYSYPRVRQWLREHGIRSVTPLREDQRAKQYRTDLALGR